MYIIHIIELIQWKSLNLKDLKGTLHRHALNGTISSACLNHLKLTVFIIFRCKLEVIDVEDEVSKV